jgi:hypothetical protein
MLIDDGYREEAAERYGAPIGRAGKINSAVIAGIAANGDGQSKTVAVKINLAIGEFARIKTVVATLDPRAVQCAAERAALAKIAPEGIDKYVSDAIIERTDVLLGRV